MLAKLDVRTKAFWLVAGYMLLTLFGVINSQLDPELFFAPLYLLPIAILTWYIGKWQGVTASVLSTIMWLAATIYAGGFFGSSYIYYWNSIICLALFLSATTLISIVRSELELSHNLYQLDTLTGIPNSRSFHESAQRELDRARRLNNPLTIAYIDIDDFKKINDQLGHTVGDQVIRKVAENIQQNLRKTDLVARMGGDEFAVILTEAGQEVSREVINRIRHHLNDAMQTNDWQLTFSIGVLVCIEHPKTVDEILKLSTDLRDFVKNNGKDGVCFSVYKSS